MLRGLGKLALCAVLMLALGSLAAQVAYAGCGCSKCASKAKSCGCKSKCNNCGPREFCADPGSGGYKLDLTCADACCIEPPCETEVCVEGWDLCEQWCDGLIHHPYELTFNGHGNVCDYGPCEAFIPCKRRGVICRTECKTDECGNGCPETVCEDVTRPRTIPWWFNPGHGNTYLDESGSPVCGQALPPQEPAVKLITPDVPPPSEPPTPPTPPEPPTPPTPPAPPEPPIVVDGRG